MNVRRRIIGAVLVLLISIISCSCGAKQGSVTKLPESAAVSGEAAQAYPFKDDAGRMRYRLVINGHDVDTKNLPFTYPDAPKGGYYPLVDVLAHLGVDCLSSEDGNAVTTKINGKVLQVTSGAAKMTYGSKSVESPTDTPVFIDSCIYVPSFLFMVIFDDGIVNFNGDRSAATLDTSTAIKLADSGTEGLSIPNTGAAASGSSGSGSSGGGRSDAAICGTCNGSGHSICTYCGGTGTKVEYQQAYDPISKQYKQTQKTVFCPRCGGRGQVVCPSCGGTGKR